MRFAKVLWLVTKMFLPLDCIKNSLSSKVSSKQINAINILALNGCS